MPPGRFFLSVGPGEAPNEHILGDRWPSSGVRREMLEEAVAVIRPLWQERSQSHFSRHYTVEASIFTLPDEPTPIVVSGFGEHAIDPAARIGDGYFTTAPDPERWRGGARAAGAASATARWTSGCGSTRRPDTTA